MTLQYPFALLVIGRPRDLRPGAAIGSPRSHVALYLHCDLHCDWLSLPAQNTTKSLLKQSVEVLSSLEISACLDYGMLFQKVFGVSV